MIEDIFNDLTKTNIAVGVFCLWVLWNIVTRIDEERRIAAYGKHAPAVRCWLPYSKSRPYIPNGGASIAPSRRSIRIQVSIFPV